MSYSVYPVDGDTNKVPTFDIDKARSQAGLAATKLLHDIQPNEAIVGFAIIGMERSPLCYIHIVKALDVAQVYDEKVFLNSIGEAECQLCRDNKTKSGRIY